MSNRNLSNQSRLISKLGAHHLAARPFHYHSWPINADVSSDHAESLKDTVRVYYNSRYIHPEQLPRLLTHVPYICVDGDSHIVTQDGKKHNSLRDALRHHPYLITPEERRISRNKCTISLAKVYAIGGYGMRTKSLSKDQIFDCIVISGAGAQFEADYLDYSDFIITRAGLPNRLPAYAHFGEVPSFDAVSWAKARAPSNTEYAPLGMSDVMLHVRGLRTSLEECLHLWLCAFDDTVRRLGNGKQGYLKLTAIGTGFFAEVVRAGVSIGDKVMSLLIESVEAVLARHKFHHIATIEFPDFSDEQLFTPRRDEVNGIRLLAAPYTDVLAFPDEVKSSYNVGVLNPGDCFSCVGNELENASVEAMIGNNTTIRLTQCYIWNEKILDEHNWVPVEA